ncbi:hypothetical protein [Bizionia arctica]|uniref:Uncharacterized protein n=1 Tax=Bizionia arctica TaxID=1495645 RepID=A0A917LN25_9FLAO|nr:hypothetical protein [Bizionia arctica]GGG45358.1 hypothetical protein GCM10010976_16220 [Bizionia arctica]
METVIFLAIFNMIVLLIAIKTKKYLYTITPEKQWSKEIEEFDKNYKIIENIDVDNYTLGSGHLYEK